MFVLGQQMKILSTKMTVNVRELLQTFLAQFFAVRSDVFPLAIHTLAHFRPSTTTSEIQFIKQFIRIPRSRSLFFSNFFGNQTFFHTWNPPGPGPGYPTF